MVVEPPRELAHGGAEQLGDRGRRRQRRDPQIEPGSADDRVGRGAQPAGERHPAPRPLPAGEVPLVAQLVVRRGDGGAADPEPRRERPFGGEPALDGDPPIEDERADRRGEPLLSGAALPPAAEQLDEPMGRGDRHRPLVANWPVNWKAIAGRLGWVVPRPRTRRLCQLFVGLILYGVSSSMLLLAGLGVDPWDVLHQGLSRRIGLGVGTWAIIVGLCVLLLWIPLRQRPGLGTVCNVIVVGLVIDVMLATIHPIHDLPAQIAVMLGAVILNGIATGAYIGAGLGPGPRDGLMTGLAARGHSIRDRADVDRAHRPGRRLDPRRHGRHRDGRVRARDRADRAHLDSAARDRQAG